MYGVLMLAAWQVIAAAPPPADTKYDIQPPDILLLEVSVPGRAKDDPALQELRRRAHLVRPDGTIGLGTYGNVFVAGKTAPEARVAIERHLARFLSAPSVWLAVLPADTRVFDIITDRGAYGQRAYRFSVTHGETLRDAVRLIQTLLPLTDRTRIWLRRYERDLDCPIMVLSVRPVDWRVVLQENSANAVLCPGDRLYVDEQREWPQARCAAVRLSPIECQALWWPFQRELFDSLFGVMLLPK